MAMESFVKDIDTTLTRRRNRRNPREIPYPISYCNKIADFDIWDHMFLSSYFQDLTMHKFSQPPKMILDLGCGSGFWAIEAAKQWKHSTILGFDIAKVQPSLNSNEHFGTLAHRLEWIHGNFLDGLPFASNYFDFVRIAGLGLAIPEDEWPFVLEEVRRILKPGGVVEIIEDDLLFPCPSSELQVPPRIFSPSLSELPTSKATYYRPLPERILINTTSSEPFSLTTQISRFLPNFQNPTPSTNFIIPSPSSSEIAFEHPQDHTRLKLAWEAMLETRFLSPKLLSVIPFYLTASSFIETQAYIPVVIPLPPNSGSIPTLRSSLSLHTFQKQSDELTLADTLFDFTTAPSFKANSFSFRSSIYSTCKPQLPAYSGIHLAKTLNNIQGCKEAIWVEYKNLYSTESHSILSRIAPDEEDHISQRHSKSDIRKAFEIDWRNWELDMVDRIGMKNMLQTHLGWTQSMPEEERDIPDCQAWRNKFDQASGFGHMITGYNADDICRSLRVFTGCKS